MRIIVHELALEFGAFFEKVSSFGIECDILRADLFLMLGKSLPEDADPPDIFVDAFSVSHTFLLKERVSLESSSLLPHGGRVESFRGHSVQGHFEQLFFFAASDHSDDI